MAGQFNSGLRLRGPGLLAMAHPPTTQDPRSHGNTQLTHIVSVALDAESGKLERVREKRKQRRLKQKVYKQSCHQVQQAEHALQMSVAAAPSDEGNFTWKEQRPPPELYMPTFLRDAIPKATPSSWASTFPEPMYVTLSLGYAEVGSQGSMRMDGSPSRAPSM
eukprot:TRINITY_DN121693_c0_g1_i1.p1 TRINITY_DN121693_c0_g1~~TRINITY_DN121693_c0_g1_i1.p1  ORF type:complete len:163 (+),score=27.80 TRINITY_DN121693_c0_g1_i1:106-594(+)